VNSYYANLVSLYILILNTIRIKHPGGKLLHLHTEPTNPQKTEMAWDLMFFTNESDWGKVTLSEMQAIWKVLNSKFPLKGSSLLIAKEYCIVVICCIGDH